MTLSITNGQITFVDPNKVATKTRNTHSAIEWKDGSMNGMIRIEYIITLNNLSYNTFTIDGNGGSGSLGSSFHDFLGNQSRSN